jgi:hypothetical protein
MCEVIGSFAGLLMDVIKGTVHYVQRDGSV